MFGCGYAALCPLRLLWFVTVTDIAITTMAGNADSTLTTR
jgi:hypothetical protein